MTHKATLKTPERVCPHCLSVCYYIKDRSWQRSKAAQKEKKEEEIVVVGVSE